MLAFGAVIIIVLLRMPAVDFHHEYAASYYYAYLLVFRFMW